MSLFNRNQPMPKYVEGSSIIRVDLGRLKSITRNDISDRTEVVSTEKSEDGSYFCDVYDISIEQHNKLVNQIKAESIRIAGVRAAAQTLEEINKINNVAHVFLIAEQPAA